ncbi:hypothetical protein P152DRAFT_454240 [Eremomyces bilateralis CBS 781.70]|uniref:Protein-lysine N-methyltransferase EFM5 n=1 Tax=Eremomyces bilateralis CBS 781.70 TaxID=1392243 RepID=A0A6G1GHU0_9PEZI|nr:uncharacterized protein P152DRAFT_454240 [Eremomyces bilateralis CBS 781.70]KAF1817667.1 hypothetical protein P152DRAFT_454240 [Eremomyces bilateralis CBS 781.70]
MASHGEDEEDVLRLPAATLALLEQFYDDREAQEARFEDLKTKSELKFDKDNPLSMELFTEDWNASQFWYDDPTATALARELLEDATDETCIAVVSAPSVFIQLKNLQATEYANTHPTISLLEYDDRFAVFKEFVQYDFKYPFVLPAEMKGKYHRIICDPPFLSDDCQTRTAITARWLSSTSPEPGRGLPASEAWKPELIICTGERMEQLILKLYSASGVRTTSFEPKHAKELGNEFRCYANSESKASLWSWR